jgi:hypothetical protein
MKLKKKLVKYMVEVNEEESLTKKIGSIIRERMKTYARDVLPATRGRRRKNDRNVASRNTRRKPNTNKKRAK